MTAVEDATDVVWDLSDLLDGRPVDALLDDAIARAERLAGQRTTIATLDAAGLASFMAELATINDLAGRAASYASLTFAAATSDPEAGALMQRGGGTGPTLR